MSSKKVSEFDQIISNTDLQKFLESQGFKKPTQVQGDCIPALLADENISVQGRTGSGKTLGYLLPIIQKLKDNEGLSSEEKAASPKVLIILPTRELALQVFSISKSISHFAKMRVRKLVGGDKGTKLATLFKSQIDILITTPDRCLRAFKGKELSTNSLKHLIMDEADQLLELSFKKTVSEMIPLLMNNEPQVILVSASRPENFAEIIAEYFPSKKFLTIGKGEENILNHKVKTYNISLEDADKFIYVSSFIKKQNFENGLIFTGNKARAKKVFNDMTLAGHKKLFLLHKDLEVLDRVKTVEKFRQTGGTLIATDIFARGIDIDHLKWVLNFDLPSEPDYYLHRSGRVGRAGRAGDVFNFVTSKDKNRLKRINQTLIVQGRQDLSIRDKANETEAKRKPKQKRKS
jgi:superfamily II DNA/RNA helicase